MTIAVDFDGTLCEDRYPEIGEPNYQLIGKLIKMRRNGDKLILWTCRTGTPLKKAVEWCEGRGLFFDKVNENLDENVDDYGNTRKVYADIYIDNESMNLSEFLRVFGE
jgi:hypothetical protein